MILLKFVLVRKTIIKQPNGLLKKWII